MSAESVRALSLDGHRLEVMSAYLDQEAPEFARDGWRITARAQGVATALAGRRAVVATLEDGSTFVGVGLVKTSIMAATGITITVMEIIRSVA